jgi:hypothetical protein
MDGSQAAGAWRSGRNLAGGGALSGQLGFNTAAAFRRSSDDGKRWKTLGPSRSCWWRRLPQVGLHAGKSTMTAHRPAAAQGRGRNAGQGVAAARACRRLSRAALNRHGRKGVPGTHAKDAWRRRPCAAALLLCGRAQMGLAGGPWPDRDWSGLRTRPKPKGGVLSLFFEFIFNVKTIPEKSRNSLKARKILWKSQKFQENARGSLGHEQSK